mgnify:CR=1 FL=1
MILIGGIPAGPELLIVLLVLILLFGSSKIPKLARSTGQALGEFKKGREQSEQEFQDEDWIHYFHINSYQPKYI